MISTASIPHLLLVEDHRPSRETLMFLLKSYGYSVAGATNAREARQLTASTIFDILLCDIGLPDEDGYSLMRSLKIFHPTLKGIALTAYSSDEHIRRSELAGFAAHLVKPVTFTRLKSVLWSIYGGAPAPANSPSEKLPSPKGDSE